MVAGTEYDNEDLESVIQFLGVSSTSPEGVAFGKKARSRVREMGFAHTALQDSFNGAAVVPTRGGLNIEAGDFEPEVMHLENDGPCSPTPPHPQSDY